MEAFLDQVTRHILKKYPDETGEICIVTPNRRAGLFIRKYFAAAIDKPAWAPEILSIEDFINRISGYTVPDNIGLQFELYTVYQGLERGQAESIDSFLQWSPVLIRDFDDIDNSMADPDKLYSYLQDIRYIDTWNPDGSPLTAFQQQYLDFIKKIQVYHNKFGERLLPRNLAWQGLSSRHAANMVVEGTAELPRETTIFAGFNALTRAEETIITALLKEGKAEYLTDEDPFYTEDNEHEAGQFIRQYRKMFNLPAPDAQSGYFKHTPKNIHILGIARNVNQARLAGNLLRNEAALTGDEDTALVLANENLLIPVLNTLPADIQHINVTMGYPLSKTNMFDFFDALVQLQLNADPGSHDSQDGPAYYHKDIHRLFSHSSSSLLWDTDHGETYTSTLTQNLNASNQSFCTFDTLKSFSPDPEGFARAFSFLQKNRQKKPEGMISDLLELTGTFDRLFREKAASQGKDIVNTPFFADFESLYSFATLLRRLEAYLQDYAFIEDLKTVQRLLKQAAAESRLSFSGEPLQGLQVMGMLETRSLDFTNVILLSANESILPKPTASHSFIPYEVKRSFGLRVYHDQDAIYAYHFYRLLQRAENIYIIYNTQSQDIGTSEKSRFITQLQYELPGYNPSIHIREEIISLPAPVNKKEETVIIEKTDDILRDLSKAAQKGFSPSALSKYINCPLQFYFERLAGLDETDAVEETLEASTIGNIVHGVLEELYKPYTGKTLTVAITDNMVNDLADTVSRLFAREYSGGNIHQGKNLLLYHMIRRYLENILLAEKSGLTQAAEKNIVVTLESLEQTLEANIQAGSTPYHNGTIHMKGKADRIDRHGGVVRIIDYKTGKVQPNELSFQEWAAPFTNSVKARNFQLLCYAWLYHKNFPDIRYIEPGIISTRNPSVGLQSMKHPGGKGILQESDLAEFEVSLQDLLKEIMDPATPFSQTGDEDRCKYCTFKVFCRRY